MNTIKYSKKEIHSLLYLYTLGSNNNHDSMNSLVPYKIDENELFFGPCKVEIRKEIKAKWKNSNENIDELPNIFLVGISPSKSRYKKVPKNILFAGKIEQIYTFEKAWKYYHLIKDNNEKDEEYRTKIKKMICGVGEKTKEKSPLFLEPFTKNGKSGYKHRTEMHKDRWQKDLLSTSQRKKYEKIHEKISQNYIEKIETFNFDLDCCFRLTNIHFSHRNNPEPIELDNNMLELIKKGLSEKRKGMKNSKQKPPDLSSPYGYNVKGQKYGRLKFVELKNDNAEELINQIKSKKKVVDN